MKNNKNLNIEQILQELLKQNENEVVEFKEAKKNYDFGKIGKYFSALSNEANLQGKDYSWLVFGIRDNDHAIIGTAFREEENDLQHIKGEIANSMGNGITFTEIYSLIINNLRVLMFLIPAAPKGIPTAFKGHYYARNGGELTALSIEKIERIRAQFGLDDWSAHVIEEATIDDLDLEAIEIARSNYLRKYPDKSEEIKAWDTLTFLNKAKLTIKNQITRTALILLGKSEAEHFLKPADIKIRWILKGTDEIEKDYLILSCPFFLATEKIYLKIRNTKYRYIKEGTMFPEEVERYEPFTIREAINNCIAHQDYTIGGRIDIIEREDQIIFINKGEFIPGSVEKVINDDSPESIYRNRFLVTAMFNLNMVDTVGGGIRKMFVFQKKRFFPMPEYDISRESVKLTITGKVINQAYSNLLAMHEDISLHDILLLDRVQKKLQITEEDAKSLKEKGYIEGRKPNYYISQSVSQLTNQKAEYSKNKGFNDEYYIDLLIKSIKEHDFLNRNDIDVLLWNKLPDWMNDKQKKTKISNVLNKLRNNKKIINTGSDKKPIWRINN